MTEDDFKNQIANALNVDPSQLTADASPRTLSEWDSIGALGVISVLNDLTDGDISAEDIEQFATFAAIVDFAKKKKILEN